MIIKYYKKHVYGKVNNYIIDVKINRDFNSLTYRKALSEQDIEILSGWGIKFEQTFEPENK